MSTAVSASEYMGFGARKQNTGVSSAASHLAKRIDEVYFDRQRTATIQAGQLSKLEELAELFGEYQTPNWGGYGEAPLTRAAYEEARTILELLPAPLQFPDLTPEPTGSIAMEWRIEKNCIYVLSVSGSGAIEYAGIFGRGNELHGRHNFGDFLPRQIASHLSDLVRLL